MQEKTPIKDRIFLKLINAIFYVIYGYFDPPDIATSYSITINHYKKAGAGSNNIK
jgi:hypothetical protein